MKRIGMGMLLVLAMASAAQAGTIEVCIEKYPGNERDYAALFSDGPVTVPAGTVFNYIGHTFGPPSDPQDRAHMGNDIGKSWPSLPLAERDRRNKIMASDLDTQSKDAIAISRSVILTAQQNCATATGTTVMSNDFGWKNRTITDDGRFYYQAYGTISAGRMNTAFDGGTQFDFAAQSGQLNAVVHGSLNKSLLVK